MPQFKPQKHFTSEICIFMPSPCAVESHQPSPMSPEIPLAGTASHRTRLSISHVAEQCKAHIDQLSDSASSTLPDDDGKLAAVHNARGRFNVWASDMRALKPAVSRSSLDWRLRKAGQMEEAVRSALLNMSKAANRGDLIL